jgi:hypothetical protein
MSERDDLIRKFIEKYDEIVKKALGTTFTEDAKAKVVREKMECVECLLSALENLEPTPPPRTEVVVINTDLITRMRDATPEGRNAVRKWLAEHSDEA